MKQRDIFAIALLAVIVAISGWFLTNQFIASPQNLTAEIEVVKPYTTEFSPEAKQRLLRPGAVNFSRNPNINIDGDGTVLTPSQE